MPKTTEQNLIVHTCRSKAEVTSNRRGITLRKLTTDKHKASRGLSATAEFLVKITAICWPMVW